MKAVIMAGGEGTRLRPLTLERPKPLLEIAGVPVLGHVIDLLAVHGVTEAVITVHYRWRMIADRFGDEYGGVRLHYSEEPSPLGTAGSVVYSVGANEPVLVVSGDALTDFDLTALIDRHQQRGGVVTIGLYRADDPSQYGVVITDDDGRITRFVEKPPLGTAFSDLINTGIYVVEPQALALVPEGTPYDFARDLFPRLLEDNQPLYSLYHQGYWCDIGSSEQYRQANEDAARGRIHLRQGSHISAEAAIAASARIDPHCHIGAGSIIESGVIIESGSVIGRDVIIGAGARISGAVLGDRVAVGFRSVVDRSVLAPGVVTGDGSRIGEHAVVGDRVRIGDRAAIRSGVRIWPDKQVATDDKVSHDVTDRSLRGMMKLVDGVVEGRAGVDFGPDDVAAVARAASTMLAQNKRLVIGAGSGITASVMKNAATAGAVAAGAEVYDAGVVPRPALIQTLTGLNASAGLYISTRGQRQHQLRLEMIKQDGTPCDNSDERRFSDLLADGLPPVPPGQYRMPMRAADANDAYLNVLLSHLDLTAIRRRRFRAVLALERDSVLPVVTGVCERTGIETIGAVDLVPDRSQPLLNRLAATAGVDWAAHITGEGTGVQLTVGSHWLGRDDLIVILARLLLSEHHAPVLYVPVDASGHCERLASRHGIPVSRVSRPPQGSPEFRLWADGLAQLLYIINYAATRQLSVSDILQGQPPVAVRRLFMECSRDRRPQVAKQLAAMAGERAGAQSSGGVRLQRNDGWAYITMEPDTARLKVVCEATAVELADELTADVRQMIESIVSEGGNDNAAGDRE